LKIKRINIKFDKKNNKGWRNHKNKNQLKKQFQTKQKAIKRMGTKFER
jgi:hypothetical protein